MAHSTPGSDSTARSSAATSAEADELFREMAGQVQPMAPDEADDGVSLLDFLDSVPPEHRHVTPEMLAEIDRLSRTSHVEGEGPPPAP